VTGRADAPAVAEPVLTVDGLRLAAATELVHGVSFSVAAGEAVGIVGESGSGKSLTLRAALGLLPAGVRRTGGSVTLRAGAGMVFQDPLAALDPLMSIGAQLEEVCRTTGGLDRAAARARSIELLTLVRIPDPERRRRDLPGRLSGGQRQRVVLAIALATDPSLLLCDEPTTALDVTVQAQILDLLDQLRRELGLAMVFVSHDLAVVGRVCSRILVMSNGEIVESGPTREILTAPKEPYTRMLLGSVLTVPPIAEEVR
jgi:ABC-type glutathione transport system ATPase component